MATARRQTWPCARKAELDLEHLALSWVECNRGSREGMGCHRRHSSSQSTATDPTRGATRYHRHDETPRWARNLTPVALIGAYLFYAD